MGSAVRFKQAQIPRQASERGRLKVVQGPDSGAVYVIIGDRASLGRGDENDIIISDLKASRTHAVILVTPQGVMIEDQGSASGILYQGEARKRLILKSGTVFMLGGTTLQFISADSDPSLLMASPGAAQSFTGLPAAAGQASDGNPGKLVIYAVIGLGIYLLVPGGNRKPAGTHAGLSASKVTATVPSQTTNLADYLPASQPSRTAELMFKDGMREYFDGNFNRAKIQFETVLQIRPGHPMAKLYLEKCTLAVKEEVKTQMFFAKRALDAGKLREARSHYDRVMRLLYRDQTESSFIEAKEQFEKVSKLANSGGIAGP